MVDHVIIDNNEKPLKILNILKPDFFAKGFGIHQDICHQLHKESKVVRVLVVNDFYTGRRCIFIYENTKSFTTKIQIIN